MEDLQGKVAVITGGASGIGRAVAERAAAEGMKIVLGDIEEGPLKEAVDDLTSQGAEALGVVTDVSDARVGARRCATGPSTASAPCTSCTTTPASAWAARSGRSARRTGAGSSASTCGASSTASPPSCPLLIEQGEGHVVNTASIAGLIAAPFLGPYNATKQAVVAISETLFKDLQAVGAPGRRLGPLPRLRADAHRRVRAEPARRGRPTATCQGRPSCAAWCRTWSTAGSRPPTVADRVIDAVRANTFYILTHPELDAAIATRFDDILQGRPPSPTMIA